MFMQEIAAVAVAYLVGSIPFAFLLARRSGIDLRHVGSGNIGASNVLRTSGVRSAVLAMALDAAKGSVAVLVAQRLAAGPGTVVAAGLASIIGHIYPVWLRFHGGKGVATAAGAFLALDPLVVAGAVIVFLIVLIVSRFVSLASIVAAASIPIFFRFLAVNAPFWRIVISIVIAIIVIVKHHSNIARLAQRTERKLGEKRDDQ